MTTTGATALPVYLTEQIRRIEALAVADADPPLMQRAGLAAAELARDLIVDTRRPILIFAGPGNNGGDAFVVASHLMQWWHRVSVVFDGDVDRLSAEARAAYDAWRKASGEVLTEPPSTSNASLVVDGLFGIGLQRDLDGRYAQWVSYINDHSAPVLALDVPSGLHSDTGRVLGNAVRADHTMTFIGLKPGLLTLDGPDFCGELHVHDLGLEVEQLLIPDGFTLDASLLAQCLPPRAANSHKGTYGSIGIVGGAPGMCGAALLAGRAALKLGAGRVYVGLLDASQLRVDPVQPELMLREADEVLSMPGLSCMVLGPGLSRADHAKTCVARALELQVPLVIDADALNLIAEDTALQDICRTRNAPTLLTPHPAEAARLRQLTTADIQQDRLAAARALAQQYQAVVALKGAGTVIAASDERFYINTSGNAGLASAGMGDVLSGILGALLSQGAGDEMAMCAGVHLHGAAADHLYATQAGLIGMTGSELTDAARALLNRAIYAEGSPKV
jgi:hydroxyethylthiazole kinase-like uncharacterized protein yjeF